MLHATNSELENYQNVDQKRERNRATLISRLAVELLSAIFLEVRTLTLLDAKYSPNSEISRQYLGAKGWIRVTHVCHRWRSVAIGLPQLWSLIRLDPLASTHHWAEEMLWRSKGFPATVYVDLSGYDSDEDEEDDEEDERLVDMLALLNIQVKGNVSRLKELRLRRLNVNQLGSFFSRQLSAPLLESFRIACLPSDAPFTLNDQLFQAPALKKLSLVCCRTDWDSQLFRNLTHLRLCYPPDGHRISISRFLDVLSRILKLESLSLRDAFGESAENSGSSMITKDKVKLPFLQDIHLNITLDFLADFLPTVDIPSSSIVRIESFWNRQTQDPFQDYYRVIRALPSFLRASQNSQVDATRLPIRTLQITKSAIENYEDFTIKSFYEVYLHEEMEETTFQPPLNFHFSWEDVDPEDFPDFSLPSDGLWSILPELPLEDLVTLEVGAGLCIDDETWKTVFGVLPNLQSILLEDTGHSFNGLFTALGRIAGYPAYFEALKTIILQESESNENIELVVEVLVWRSPSQFDYPIEYVSLPTSFKFKPTDGDYMKIGGCDVHFTDAMLEVWQKAEHDSDSDDDLMIGIEG